MMNNTEPFLNRGEKIGVYEIERWLGSDEFSIRYLALNHHLNERVVLTEYFPESIAFRNVETLAIQPKSDKFVAAYNQGLAAFIGRADALSQVQHDSVLTIHNVLPFNETAYCVAEHLDENPLSIVLERSNSELTHLFVCLLDGLEQIHKMGVLHRAITPEAVCFRADKTPVLTGFDRYFCEDQLVSAENNECGDTPYFALEQYEGQKIGPETDLYGLGAIIYACLSHRDPVASRFRFEAVSSDLSDPLEPFSKMNKAEDIPTWAPLIDRMLSLHKHDRPATASDAWAEFNRMIEDEKVRDGRLATGRGVKESNSIRTILAYVAGIAVIVFLVAFFFTSYRNDEDKFERTIAATTSSSETQLDQIDVEALPTEIPDQNRAANFAALESNAKPRLKLPVEEELSEVDEAIVENSKVSQIEKNGSAPFRIKSADLIAGNGISSSKRTGDSRVLASISQPWNDKAEQETDESRTTIAAHLNAAKNDFNALRLTTPAGTNAYEHYVSVLSLDPENKEALEGTERIVDMYVWLIGNAMQQGGHKLARTYLARAEKIVANNPSLENLRQELKLTEN